MNTKPSCNDLAATFSLYIRRRDRGTMPIPALNPDGLLPVGVHTCDWPEVQLVFVDQAPHPAKRRKIYAALQMYVSRLTQLIPSGTMWINGGFTTHKAKAPEDVDLALLVDPALTVGWGVREQDQLGSLITLRGAYSTDPPLTFGRLQPMAGLVDAFMIAMSDVAARQLWEGTWSTVVDENKVVVPGARKGFLEVNW